MKFVLASASPRRRELLLQIIPSFEVAFPNINEERYRVGAPEEIVCHLAEAKCESVFKSNPEKTVIGCDTLVIYEGEAIGKPQSKLDAVLTLKKLSGKVHSVLTGVCVRNRYNKFIEFERTDVKMNTLSDQFIKQYVESGKPLDKAGSYGIQDGGLVDEYFGSYTNIMGLPVPLVKKMIKEVLSDV